MVLYGGSFVCYGNLGSCVAPCGLLGYLITSMCVKYFKKKKESDMHFVVVFGKVW